MTTYFLNFKITPTLANEHFDLVEGAYASCWVLADDSQEAYRKALFYIKKSDWTLKVHIPEHSGHRFHVNLDSDSI